MLGALVALVKLSSLADVVPGIALISYGLLMLALSALTSATPTEQLWRSARAAAPLSINAGPTASPRPPRWW
jgi:paraquat-inducible protein A